MTSAVGQPVSNPSLLSGDRRMAIIGTAGIALSIAALLARLADLLPSGFATVIVLVGATISLRVAFRFAAKSASAPSRARMIALVSTVGLSISGVTMLAALPHLTKSGGIEKFVIDLFAQLWALAILAVAAGSVRTLGWRAFVGAGLTGFLAIPAMAALVGRPVVTALGTSSLLAVGLWVPLTEELCKMIPVAFVAIVALRRTAIRPSALDLMMLGAWTGAGFALYENATFGRGTFDLSAVPGISLLFPAETRSIGLGSGMVHSGHLVFSALIALGIALAFLYRRHFKRPELVLLAAFLAAFIEHAANNAIAARQGAFVAQFALAVSFGGVLSSCLLIAGIGYALYLERRALGLQTSWPTAFRPENWVRPLHPDVWLKLSAAETQRRTALLARGQSPDAQLIAVPRARPA